MGGGDVNLKKEDIEQFDRMFNAAIEFARTKNLPLGMVENSLRNTLAGVEAQRLLGALRSNGAKL